jgi:hypothetical protein
MDDGINFRLTNIESLLNKIFKILEGNGGEGLVTKVALVEQRVEDIPSPNKLKFFAAMGAGITTSFGLLCWLIYYFIRGAFTGGGS